MGFQLFRSKVRANAGYKNSWNAKRAQEALAKIDERIDAMLKQCDQTDRCEAKQGSLVELPKNLQKALT